MSERIWLSSPTMHGEEQVFVKEAFDTNWIAPLGKNVTEFENEVAQYLNCRGAAAVSAGTHALHMAVRLAGIQAGDIVLCSDFTFIASVNPVCYENGIPVFIDSERGSWNMNPEALEEGFRKYGSKVKAVVVANLYGTPANLEAIAELCDQYHAVLIEDAAESLSATYKGKQTGTFGTYNAISFNGNKIITTSGGGMFLSDDLDAVEKVRFYSTQARESAPWYQHEETGYNYRMSNVVAGIGRGQLLHIDEHRTKKKAIYDRYQAAFQDLPIDMNPHLPESEPNYWLSCFTIRPEAMKYVSPQKIRLALEQENVESRHIWKPMHMQPIFKASDYITVNKEDVGQDVFERGLCLPSDIKMTEAQQDHVIELVRNCFGK